MPERAYPITEKEQLRRRILTPQPSRAPYSPFIDLPDVIPVSTPEPDKVPGYVFSKSYQLPNGIISYNNPTGGAFDPYTAERRGPAKNNRRIYR
ncbi:hypothetical protein HZF02_05645 [Pseudomonas yamanorum]|nr:hypothetical protein HZF02_05645 [Pseudomonas yamanorum]